jgi:myo-inositol-1(or 4)-monophosphatase
LSPQDWEKHLVDATERVWKKVSPLASEGGRGRVVGVGASGDRTIYADKLAEDELLESLAAAGGVSILSEEAGVRGGDGDAIAIVDPLDGSSNFELGIPFYCTSVAIIDGRSLGDATVGVVRDLVSGDVYSARRGAGARKNGRRVVTSEVSRLSEAVVGADLSRSSPELVAALSPLVSGARRHVHFGANALELCFVADARIDAFVDLRERIRVTDFAAAYLVAKEAGAIVTSVDGGEVRPHLDLEHRFSFVASANAALHEEILGLCRTAPGKAR